MGPLVFLGQGYPRSRFDRLTGESRFSFPPSRATRRSFVFSSEYFPYSRDTLQTRSIRSLPRVGAYARRARYDQRGNRIGMKAQPSVSPSAVANSDGAEKRWRCVEDLSFPGLSSLSTTGCLVRRRGLLNSRAPGPADFYQQMHMTCMNALCDSLI